MVGLTALRKYVLILLALNFFTPAQGAEREFRLSAPQSLIDSNFLQYLLPRFSLKHGIRITLVEASADAKARLAPDTPGIPVFHGPEYLWHLEIAENAGSAAERFAEWLGSNIGIRTIEAFESNGSYPFSVPAVAIESEPEIEFAGDPGIGKEVARQHCARCHTVRDDERMNNIGSTPSFFALRTLEDWPVRFAGFYALNPHPSFTRIEGVTDPFDPSRPPPIVPLEITLEELEAVLAYVAGLPPADLGAEIQFQ